MPCGIIQAKVINEIRQIIEDYKHSTSQISHNGLKGSFREFGIGRLFEKYLPSNFSIGKGLIVDNLGSESSEIDLLIYDNTDTTPFLFGDKEGIYPLESCKYVFEIKSKSNSTEIQSTIEKFRKLKSLKSLNNSGPITVYFAYSSDLVDISEFERYMTYDSNYNNYPAIDVICVIDQGYWYRRDSVENGERLNMCWQYFDSKNTQNETLSLLSGVLNTLNRKTPIGYYLLDHSFSKIAYFNFFKMKIEIKYENRDYYKLHSMTKRNFYKLLMV